MQVLGFDPSMTNFGWALHETQGTGQARCPDRGRFQTSSDTLFIARYTDLRQRVRELLARTGVRHVGCEYPVFNNLWSEGMYGLFLYTCEAMWLEGVNVVFFSPGQLKAHARVVLDRPKVNGKLWVMQKSDMSEAARHDCGDVGGAWNHNEADAYFAARTAGRFWQYFKGEITDGDLDDLERKQFAETYTYKRGQRAGQTAKSGIAFREDERFFQWCTDLDQTPP